MSYETWPSIIVPPQDGEPVDNATTARAHQSLSDRTEYLKQQLEDYSTKNGRVTIQSAYLAEAVNIGDAVYYDGINKKYDRALAEGITDPSTGLLSATSRAFVIGLCVSKEGNYGTILISGNSDLYTDFGVSPSDLFDVSSNYYSTGTRGYLSSFVPGKMTSKPTSPLVQIGLFSSDKSFIAPLQKDIFESHLHYRFPIKMVPAASQNVNFNTLMSGTGLFKDEDDNVYVDYFAGESTEDRPISDILLSIKKNDSPNQWTEYNPARVTIRRSVDGKKMSVTIDSNGIDKASPLTQGSTEASFQLDWPDYGEYIDITDGGENSTGLSVSFFRKDGAYTEGKTLQEDIEENLSTLFKATDLFKVYLPDDLNGWTNANKASPNTPVNANYRLVHESIGSLNAVWPPTPLESTLIETNGVHRMRDIEFLPTMTGVYWTAMIPPWNWEGLYSGTVPSGMDLSSVRDDLNSFLYFSKTSLENSRSVVLSLGSNTPMISVTDCFTGKASQSGHLKLDLDLSLNEEISLGSSYAGLASIDPSTNKFKRSTIVSELVAGSGISISRNSNIPTGVTSNCGKLTISRSDMKFEGIVEVVSLLNAKEDLINDIVPAIIFPQPSTGRYRMISRVKIPNNDISSNSTIQVRLYASTFGTEGSSGKISVFDLKHYIVRAGKSINNLATLSARQLGIAFDAYPTPYVIQDAGYIAIANSRNESIQIGDHIYTVWERKSEGVGGSIDNYVGNVGFLQIRWEINID
jgi:hypothetical protein